MMGLGVAIIGVVAAVPIAAVSQQIWLGGVDPVVRHVMAPEQKSDYMDLFRSDSPWSRAAAHVQVFKTSTQFLSSASDDELRRMFADLAKRHIALATAALMQTAPSNCGQGVEGYAAPGAMPGLAQRVKELGGRLDYVAMDEPLWFGHVYGGPNACRSAIGEIARDVAANAAAIRRIFPDAKIGDVEPIAAGGQPPDWLDQIGQWIAAYRTAAGANLAFFDVDVDWTRQWHPQLETLRPMLLAAGVGFGIIYDGDANDVNGLEWTRHAEEHFVAVEADPALTPDQAILQTWNTYPSHMLPESQAGTMTWLVTRYAAGQTRMILQRSGNELRGQLIGPGNKGVAGQRVQILAIDNANAGPPGERAVSGTVPAGAAHALFILRLNTECKCSGPINITLGQVRYRDDDNGQQIARMFEVPQATRETSGIHLVAPAGRAFAPNTEPWSVRPGDRWTVQLTMGASSDSAHSGYLALSFQTADGKGLQRVYLPIAPAATVVGEPVTDADGRFAFTPPASILRLRPGFQAEFSGTSEYRLSDATVP